MFNHSKLWKVKGWNIDRRVFELAVTLKVKEFHYYMPHIDKLFVLSIGKVLSQLKRGNILVEHINGHTQLFPPQWMWIQQKKQYRTPWVIAEYVIGGLLVHIEELIPKVQPKQERLFA